MYLGVRGYEVRIFPNVTDNTHKWAALVNIFQNRVQDLF